MNEREAFENMVQMVKSFGQDMNEREAFENWLKEAGWFLDWSRFGDGYAKPAVDRAWTCWQSAVTWARHNELLDGRKK